MIWCVTCFPILLVKVLYCANLPQTLERIDEILDFFQLQRQCFFKAEVSKKTVIEEKRRVAEEKLSVAVPQRVEVMRHEGT